MGTGSFPGVERPGRGIDHPPPSRAEVIERLKLSFAPFMGLHGMFYGKPYIYLYLLCGDELRNLCLLSDII